MSPRSSIIIIMEEEEEDETDADTAADVDDDDVGVVVALEGLRNVVWIWIFILISSRHLRTLLILWLRFLFFCEEAQGKSLQDGWILVPTTAGTKRQGTFGVS